MDNRKAVVALLILVLLFAVVYAVYANIPKPGAYLEGVVKIRYEAGSEIVIGSEDRDLFNLLNYWGKQLSVIQYGNKKLWGISTDISLRFTIDPPDKALNAQFWVLEPMGYFPVDLAAIQDYLIRPPALTFETYGVPESDASFLTVLMMAFLGLIFFLAMFLMATRND